LPNRLENIFRLIRLLCKLKPCGAPSTKAPRISQPPKAIGGDTLAEGRGKPARKFSTWRSEYQGATSRAKASIVISPRQGSIPNRPLQSFWTQESENTRLLPARYDYPNERLPTETIPYCPCKLADNFEWQGPEKSAGHGPQPTQMKKTWTWREVRNQLLTYLFSRGGKPANFGGGKGLRRKYSGDVTTRQGSLPTGTGD